jgi:hypothetical protein
MAAPWLTPLLIALSARPPEWGRRSAPAAATTPQAPETANRAPWAADAGRGRRFVADGCRGWRAWL